MSSLIDLVLQKRAVIIATMLMLIGGGIWSVRSLSMELLPNVEVPLATVLVVYPGADPQSVLDEVTVPVETAIAGTRGLRNLHSTAEAGLSVTVAEFEYGTNMKDVMATINQNLASTRLPEAVQQPKVSDFDFNTFPIIRLSLTGSAGVGELGDIAESVIKPRLEAIDGVRSVDIVGKVDKQIVVSLDSERMAEARIDVSQISGVLQASNVLMPSGDVVEDNRDVPIRSGHQITSTEQIAEMVVRPEGASQMAGVSGMGIPEPRGTASGPPTGVPPGGGVPRPGLQGAPGAASAAATYRVQEGDTLWDIAQSQYGSGVMSQAIFEANRDKLAAPDLIQPGLELAIPPAGEAGSDIPSPGAVTSAVPFAAGPQESVRIRDIATVELADSENSAISRTNGRPSLGLLVYRDPGANTVEVAHAVKAAIDDILPGMEGVEVVIIEDHSRQITRSIDDLTHEAILGGVFAIVMIYLFLLSIRTTLIAAASIPLSMLVTFILLNVTGMSLNMMTLGGMAVAVGRVVDDTVVVLENVHRHARRGEGIYQSVRAGVGEVATAITSSTLTTVGVFVPLAFVGGIIGEIFRPFALTTTFALLASLLAALTAIPAMATFLSVPSFKQATKDTWLQRLYTPAIRWALRHKVMSLLLALFVMLASLASIPFIGTTFLPESNEKLIHVKVELPPGTGRDVTESVAAEVEDVIGRLDEVEVYQTNIGNTGSLLSMTGFGAGNQSTADVSVRLAEASDAQQVASTMREELRDVGSSATITVSPLDARGTGSSSVEIVVSGNDYDTLRRAAADILNRLEGVDGLANLQSDEGTAKPEVSVIVDPEKAIQHGTTAAQVAMKVREMIVGQVATQVNLGDQPVDVLVRVRPEDANSVEKLKNLTVGTLDAVPLSEIADVQLVDGPVRLTRRDQKAAITITGSITKANTGAVNSAIGQVVDSTDLPQGVSVQLGGVIEQQTEGFSSLGLALVGAVALVYLIMMATMGSVLDPLVILVSLPLASIGAMLSLLVTGRTLGMSALIGMLMLIGIVVTNAIVLLDLVRRLKSRGFGTDEALVEAGRTRIRPILMTAATTILALVPLALGLSEGSVIATEMATVVVGGLSTSTVLTLLVVPVVYSVVDGFRGGGGENTPQRNTGD